MGPVTDWAALEASLRRLPRRVSRSTDLRRSAVLVPLFEEQGELRALFTRRPDTLKAHAGQVSFPGGGIEPGEDALAAALREAEEEVALPRDAVSTLGLLHDIDTSTGFVLTPVVGRLVREVELRPNPAEVARAFSAPLAALAQGVEFRPYERQGKVWQVPFFEWDGETIWGATGRVLVDLLRLMQLMPASPDVPPRADADERR